MNRILVVRHPVVRFWSAWNQKLLKGQAIGRDICNRSQIKDECDASELNEDEIHLASFKTFVDAFFNETAWEKSRWKAPNEHFTRQAHFCPPCSLNYTVVRVESLSLDMNHILARVTYSEKTFFMQ